VHFLNIFDLNKPINQSHYLCLRFKGTLVCSNKGYERFAFFYAVLTNIQAKDLKGNENVKKQVRQCHLVAFHSLSHFSIIGMFYTKTTNFENNSLY